MLVNAVVMLSFALPTPTVDEVASPASPRLARLAAALETEEDALESFWEELIDQGTPLFEPVEGEADSSWLSFVFRGDEDTHSVSVVSGVVGAEDVATNRLQRLGKSDLWFNTRQVRSDLRGTYGFAVNDAALEKQAGRRSSMPARRRDVLNPRRWDATSSVLEGPAAPPQSWHEKNLAAEPGQITYQSAFHSEILDNDRRIAVYTPPGYVDDDEPYPMLLCFDLSAYTSLVPTPIILDNLIDAGKIPPMVAVLVGNADRGTELPCNPRFAEMLATELIPWVRARYHVSEDPSTNVVAGSSYGGLASSWFAFQHPEIVGNVLSQSGSYWWSPDFRFDGSDPAIEAEWLTRQYARTARKDLRFYMDVGLHEGGSPSMVVVNRHLRTVLEARGYEIVEYAEFNGGHEYVVWRGTLADGLIALVGDL